MTHPAPAGLTPAQIVAELDRYIVGQGKAKRAVAIALRNRWRRQMLPPELRDEVAPKNIIMIGPTGVGKTEVARRLARLAQAPFIKVEASKYTEVGYVGRDVESMVRDLTELGVTMVKSELMAQVKEKAESLAEDRLLELLLPRRGGEPFSSGSLEQVAPDASREATLDAAGPAARQQARRAHGGAQAQAQSMPTLGSSPTRAWRDGHPAQGHAVQRAADPHQASPRPGGGARPWKEEAQSGGYGRGGARLSGGSGLRHHLSGRAGPGGRPGGGHGGRVGRVKRDLLPIVEGSSVTTKYGVVRTDHVLFIAAGAFHIAKPSDLIPELQGRFPIRVELEPLTREDFVRILTEPENALIRQYVELLRTEQVTLRFLPEAVEAIAETAMQVNTSTENIGPGGSTRSWSGCSTRSRSAPRTCRAGAGHRRRVRAVG